VFIRGLEKFFGLFRRLNTNQYTVNKYYGLRLFTKDRDFEKVKDREIFFF